MAWTAATSCAFFYLMKRLGYLRIDRTIEMIGLDIAEMGGLSNELYEKLRQDFPGSSINVKNTTYDKSEIG